MRGDRLNLHEIAQASRILSHNADFPDEIVVLVQSLTNLPDFKNPLHALEGYIHPTLLLGNLEEIESLEDRVTFVIQMANQALQEAEGLEKEFLQEGLAAVR